MKLNFRDFGDGHVGISLDETTTESDLENILDVFNAKLNLDHSKSIPDNLVRGSRFLSNSVFTKHRSETEMLRYMHKLELKDLSLNTSMIPLGSCTMKLNATTEMKPVTWPEFSNVHPFAPTNQVGGYHTLINELGDRLIQLTGFDAISMQPNSGAQGEYAGLMTIRAFHKANNQQERGICLIPSSAHGTNPASAIMAGMKVVVVDCDDQGNIDEVDFKNKATEHRDSLSAIMITYPSTHGVFEPSIKQLCEIAHDNGGQVYMDGANLNALVGLCAVSYTHLRAHETR